MDAYVTVFVHFVSFISSNKLSTQHLHMYFHITYQDCPKGKKMKYDLGRCA